MASINIQPETLSLKSEGQWITTHIELPQRYDASQIDISTVKLNNVVFAESNPEYGFVKNPEIKDRDENGLPELMVKFNRKELINLLKNSQFSLILTGRLKSGVELKAVDSINVIQ